MALTKKDIEHMAHLARLSLSEEEKDRFGAQLSSILGYVAQLQEVDAKGIVTGYQVEGLSNVLSNDEAVESDEETRKRLIAAMPDSAGDLLKVKGVFG